MNIDYRWYWAAGLLGLVLLVYLLQPILSPFLIGMLLAYLGDPLVDRLERKGISRVWGVSLVFALATFLLILMLLILVPLLGSQIVTLKDQVPAMIDWFNNTALPWVQSTLRISLSDFQLADVRETLKDNLGQTGGLLSAILAQATRSTMALLTWVANLVMIPVVGFYLLRDWDQIIVRCRELLPRHREPLVVKLVGECDEVLGAFIRGQLLVMLALGVIYSLGLWLVGLELALLIGMLAGLASIVPYLGFFVGISAALIAAIFQFGDLFHLVAVVAVFGIGQIIESTLLTPLLVGDRIGLHPVAVIFAILAGGQLFGFVGILLALPVAAVVMVLLRHVYQQYKASAAYDRTLLESAQAETDEAASEAREE
ncbi:AI-2E family transporter [Halopseudomonas phragmitis]|uniref:AI-2E family transporter n=2 Tax=Pseudomonadaceae TaxID=135621 RepID=A0A1V0B561_9GAMM|nr:MULTISPECIES: AI-2E family transporter [Pseudomonadaceae]AQZ95047.1 AI-2E family transporter [Halopseudomonas phragmitis]RHW21841.1 AI-2E family transporter [Pseudomonas jilinensis]